MSAESGSGLFRMRQDEAGRVGAVGKWVGCMVSKRAAPARGREQLVQGRLGMLGRRAGDSRARSQVSGVSRSTRSCASFLPGPGRVPFLAFLAVLAFLRPPSPPSPAPARLHLATPFTHGHLSYGTASFRASISTRIDLRNFVQPCYHASDSSSSSRLTLSTFNNDIRTSSYMPISFRCSGSMVRSDVSSERGPAGRGSLVDILTWQ